MMSLRTTFALPFLLLSVAIAFAVGCGGTRVPPNTLIYGRGEEAESLDPIATDSGESAKVIANLYDTLVTWHETDLKLVPSLAERWEMSGDGKTWTFYLRPNVKFHDGAPVDADAIVFSFERLILEKHPHVYSEGRPFRPAFTDIESVRAVDPLTVEFKLKAPNAVFLNNVAMFPASIVSPAAVKKLGKEFSAKPVGSGPFKFEMWSRTQELVLAANDDYFRGRPSIDRLIFVPIPESATAVQKLRRGEVHIADNIPPAEINSIAEHPDIRVQEKPGMNVCYLSIQNKKGPLAHAEVRRAIAHAIDKNALVATAYAGFGEPAATLIPPTLLGHDAEIAKNAPVFDPALAKEMLAAAAKEHGFQLPLKLRLFVMETARPYVQQPDVAASFIKDALAKIGIQCEVVRSQTTFHFQQLRKGEHDLGIIGWSSDNADPDNMLAPLIDLGPDDNNNNFYFNPDIHERLVAARQTNDEAERVRIYREVQQILADDLPCIPLVFAPLRLAQRKNLEGFQLHPTDTPWMRNARIK